jgi:hypothetical protein
VQFPCHLCPETLDSEHHLAEHLAADHNQHALLDQLEERHTEEEEE